MGVLQVIIRLSLVATLIKLAMATDHIVGGPNGGWDATSNLQSWGTSQQFSVGDNLIFQYQPNHNVIEVTKADYDSCQATSPIQSYSDGATTIPLSSPGKRYFICGAIGHCTQGMKVEIDTLSSSTSSDDSPAASPLADSPTISSIIPSESPEESTTLPAESPEDNNHEAPSPLFETNLGSPSFSPVVPSTEFPAAASPLAQAQKSSDLSASSTRNGDLQASVAIVLSFLIMFIAF
ncbi:uclacyanin 1-like [Lotus japonicus]|uniref:uclacyanin 1-like n=1 Tax=Lotus japonicus TaxID=34305 RepID=UPI002587402A|nr:uclacyanin 1-like [Lotus japonicus]